MKKFLFHKKLDTHNVGLRDYLLNKFSKYVDLEKCNLLEVGCGNGRFAALLGPRVKSYTGIEPDKEYLKIAKKTTPKGVKAQYYKGSAENIPVKNKKYDIILYAFSWHFINDFDKAVYEAKKLLKKNGVIVIYEPSKNTSNWASPVLRKDRKEFNEKTYKRKLLALERGRRAISKFKGLSVVEKEVDEGEKPNLWVLRHSP